MTDNNSPPQKDIKKDPKMPRSRISLAISFTAISVFLYFIMFETYRTITPQDDEVLISCNTEITYNIFRGQFNVCQLRLNTFSLTPSEITYSISKQQFKYQAKTSFQKKEHTWMDRVQQKTKEYQSLSLSASISYSRSDIINTFLDERISSIHDLQKSTKYKLDRLLSAYIEQNKNALINQEFDERELKELSVRLSRQSKEPIKMIHLKTQDLQDYQIKPPYTSELDFSNLIPLTPIQMASRVVEDTRFNPRWFLNYLQNLLYSIIIIMILFIIAGIFA